ncbi:MAG: OmpP1/FadL family transporter [Leptospirillia bacterium]
MKRFAVCGGVVALLVGLSAPAFATNGYQLIGTGQGAKAMAGAVTAAPVDTMTAITNPAGMARVGERADFSMEAFMPVRAVDFTATGGARNTGGSELYGVPSVGWVAKAFNRDDMYFGGGMFATSGMGVDYDETTFAPAAAFGTSADITFSGHSAIQFWKMAPTVAWHSSDDTSIGVSLNVDYQSITMTQKIRNLPFVAAPNERDINFYLGRPTAQMGVGASVGVLHDVNDTFTIGASYTTEQAFGNGEFRLATGDLQNYNGAVGAPGTYKLALNYPQQAAIGVAMRPNDRLLFDLDLKWIDWSSTHDKVDLKGPTNAFDITGDNVGDVSDTQLEFGWDSQIVYALGVQYAANDALTLRGGFNYSKSPIGEEDVFNNMIFPAITEKHLTLGLDYKLGDHWGIGGTYMKAFKKEFTGNGDISAAFQGATGFPPSSNAKITLEETSLGLLLSYMF